MSATAFDGQWPIDDFTPVFTTVDVHACLVTKEAFASRFPIRMFMDHRSAFCARNVVSLDLGATDGTVLSGGVSGIELCPTVEAKTILSNAVFCLMFVPIDNFEVFNSVVVLHAVDVVDVFASQKLSPQMLFHNQAVFKLSFDPDIAIGWRHPSSLSVGGIIPNMAGTWLDGQSLNDRLVLEGFAVNYQGGHR